MTIQKKMEQLSVTLPEAPAKGGVYASVKEVSEGVYYISGCGGYFGTEGPSGKIGEGLTAEEGQDAARRAMLNFLSVVNTHLCSLEQVEAFVKVLVFVASSPDFYDQPKVADGATQLLTDLFGEEIGAPSRSAIGVSCLPGNTPVEIEGIVRIKG